MSAPNLPARRARRLLFLVGLAVLAGVTCDWLRHDRVLLPPRPPVFVDVPN